MKAYRFADIILPLALRGRYTYLIPEEFSGKVVEGVRVLVPFGRRQTYAGIVLETHNNEPGFKEIKAVIRVLDEIPLINTYQLKLWTWISDYYLCGEGEVMKAALPSAESLAEYRPRLNAFIRLSRRYSDDELNGILDSLKRAGKQQALLITFLSLTDFGTASEKPWIGKAELIEKSGVSTGVLDTLIAKGVLDSFTQKVSRVSDGNFQAEPVKMLSQAQKDAYDSIKRQFNEKEIVLLHGVTSSGKTEIYIHLIEEQLKAGKQVLYMLPEIALTTQIIQRLKRHFDDSTGIYHSRLNEREKVEIWKKVADDDPETGFRLVLGVRSSVFLPFSNLGLIIVDEEHDGSYKQHDPAPRYHARDTAIMLASIHKAKTILGSASPSVESYNNSLKGKFGFAGLTERYGAIKLPEIIIANTKDAYRKKMMVSHFTPELLNAIDEALGKEEQVILFRNRRGFSPYIQCSECGWIPVCVHCAVNLTYHKSINKLVCHYCGYTTDLPHKCVNCSSTGMTTRGFGTEKIEDEIKIVFPGARVARMDQDTTRSRNSFARIIQEFEERRIDILIGTQMISKGLDFENLTVVGILNADNMLNFPDFRAHERSFQLMEQVSGRAGRRSKQGKVIIQTADPSHRIIRLMLRHDYNTMFRLQSEEREAFNYPPFCRMIRVIIKHRDRTTLNHFAELLGKELKIIFGKRVLGPEEPVISRVQAWYIKNILIKIEREKPPSKAKQLLEEAITGIISMKGASSLRISVDVDPY
ncbi:MAG TPA: primosomal protein N' [Bacteroidales bacterium]|nr:primosomal protein N' [Bacteroidales bacterium]